MARMEHSHLPSYFDETIQGEEKYTLNLYNIPDNYNYNKDGYQSQTSSENSTYRGTIEIPAGLTQKGAGTYPLVHAKDVQIGNNEANRLTDKLADYDQILRELYGREPNDLESNGLQSLDKIATVLNNRTETIDNRLLDLRMFKTIAIGAESTATADPQGSKNDIVADNNGDTLTISPSNKWVKIFSNADNNSFTIGHLVPESIPNDTRIAANVDINHKADYNFNNNINGFETNDGLLNKFDVDRFQYDEAGHIIAYHKHTYELPKGFKFIAVNTGHSTDTDNKAGIGEGTCEAGALADTLTLYTGNKWINIAAQRAGTQNNANNCITFSHAISNLRGGQQTFTFTNNKPQPKFGESFQILNTITFKTDNAGHIISKIDDNDTTNAFSSTNMTVTLPMPSIELDSNSPGQIITNITKVDTEGNNGGEFKYTKTNIGALLLTGYNSSNNITVTDVADTDSLNNAIFKLQKQIKTLNIADISMGKDATQLETLDSYITNLNEDIANFKIKYNQLITQLASDLSWTDEIKTELQLDIPVEEPTENTGE